jgi:Xaa-Pro dipeptidase
MYAHHRKKLYELYAEQSNTLIYISGASVSHRYGTDFEYPFRQESNFWYLSGVNEPDFALILDPTRQEFHLLLPRRDAMYAVWMGFVRSAEHYKTTFAPDHIHYTDELESVLRSLSPANVHCIHESDARHLREFGYQTDTGELTDALAFCRVLKTPDEVKQLRIASNVASNAHKAVMKAVAPGKYEYEMMATFQHACTNAGLRHQPYGGIFAGGFGGSVLHYVENDKILSDNTLFLVDAGAESNGYAADITRTFPVNGRFNKEQAIVYDICYNMLEQSLSLCKPGVEMEEIQIQAARLMIEQMVDSNLLYGDVDTLMEIDIFALFFPHGIGHFLGLDTHDVGGYPKGVERIDRPGLRYLRARRLLEPGMVITIEPGIYFIPALLEPAFANKEQSRFLNVTELRKYLSFGGVRIEDNIVISTDSHENLTIVPKSRSDIELFMK